MRRAGDAARLLRHAGPSLIAQLVIVEAALAVVPLATIAVIGIIVGRVADDASVGAPLVLLSLLLLLQQVLGPVRAALTYRITRRVDGAVRARVMDVANGSLGIAPFEDPETLDRLELAGGTIDPFWGASPGGAAVGVVSLGGRYVQLGGAAVLLARLSWPVAAGLTATVLFAYSRSRRWNRVRLRAIRENHVAGRFSRYTSGLANTPPAAKEVRVFGALEWLEERFRQQWAEVSGARLVAWRWASTRVTLLIVAMTPAVAVAFVLTARIGSERAVSTRTLAVALQAAIALFSLLFDQRQDDAYQVDFGLEALDTLRTLEESLGDDKARRGTLDADGLPREHIRFEGVRFAYPGSEHEVFAGLDLTIPAGSSLAIVGENGAGKTTLVKLLARLHEPQAGAISIDGIPVDALDPTSWRRRLAVIFQDFVRYELPAADNVGFGGIGRIPDPGALDAAAARAGALDVIHRLPSG